MAVPHWLIGVAMLAVVGGFIAFAFRQGQQVKPDKSKDPNSWMRDAGGGPPASFDS